jgi:hypothetical protein
LPLFEQVGSVLGQANCIQGRGDVALASLDFPRAREAFGQALPLFERFGDVLGQANCIQGLGDVALAHSDHEGAREAFEQALKLYEGVPESHLMSRTHVRLAMIATDDATRTKHIDAARRTLTDFDDNDLVDRPTAAASQNPVSLPDEYGNHPRWRRRR